MTHAPIGTMRPVSSAIGMKSAGGTMPAPGRFQRTSASTPTTRPVATASSGWKWTTSSSFAIAWRRSASIAWRATARSRTIWSNIDQRPPPACLARYIAASASRMRSAASACGSVAIAMPMLPPMNAWPSWNANGWASALSSRWATAIASSGPAMSSHTSTNSSPPKRAGISWRRTAPRRRSVTASRRRSPAWWPRLSLTTLKRSRSMNSTATPRPLRSMRSSALCRRFIRSRRLGRPGERVAQELLLVRAPRGDVGEARGEDEAAVDQRPPPRVGGRLRVAVDRVRLQDADHAVVQDDVADREEERDPVLVQREQPDHHEEVEVRLDDAAPEVDEQRRARDEAGARGDHPPAQRDARQHRDDRERDHRADVEEDVAEPVAAGEAEQQQPGDVRREHGDDHAVAALEEVRREHPALGHGGAQSRGRAGSAPERRAGRGARQPRARGPSVHRRGTRTGDRRAAPRS